MKIQFTPNLQRDMYYGGSDISVPPPPKRKPKPLNIQNIDKLLGTLTSRIFDNGYVCAGVSDEGSYYFLIYDGVSNKGSKRMEVIIQKEPRMSLDENQEVHYSYLVEIRKCIPGGMVIGRTHSSPAVYPASAGIFSDPKVFSNWIDGKLRKRESDFQSELWNSKPWYEKTFIKVKDFFRASKIY